MVNNNNSNFTKEDVEKDSAVHAFQSQDEDFGFKELYEQSLNQIQYGDIATGKVVQINADTVMVDVGWKTEGFIPAKELRDEDGNMNIAVGDDIVVFIDKRDSEGNCSTSMHPKLQLPQFLSEPDS